MASLSHKSSLNAASEKACQWANYICPEGIVHRMVDYSESQRQSIEDSPRNKRQIDFDMGRFCAHDALSQFGVHETVGTADDRSPIWPGRFVGSISHSESRAWASVGTKSDLTALGVDTETIVDASSLKHLKGEIGIDAEWALLEEFGLTPEVAFTILFSAKESFYKCWAPITGEFFGFHQAELTHVDNEKIRLEMTAKNPNFGQEPNGLDVYYFVDPTDVFTVAWMKSQS